MTLYIDFLIGQASYAVQYVIKSDIKNSKSLPFLADCSDRSESLLLLDTYCDVGDCNSCTIPIIAAFSWEFPDGHSLPDNPHSTLSTIPKQNAFPQKQPASAAAYPTQLQNIHPLCSCNASIIFYSCITSTP